MGFRGTFRLICNLTLVSSRWNAAIAFASYLDSNDELINDKFVLELGAGGGLPGIVAAQNGARKVRDRYSSLVLD